MRSSGSGFLIRPGIVVTNAHVIAKSVVEKITVSFPSDPRGERFFNAKLLYVNYKRDLTVLKVESDLPPLKLATRAPRVLDKIIVIGSPGSYEGPVKNSVNRGEISNEQVVLDKLTWFQHNAPTNHGNSGGPIFNAQGEIIGVVCLGGKPGTQGMNYGIPAADVQKALEQADALTAKDPTQVPAEHNLRVGFFWTAKAAFWEFQRMKLNSEIFAVAVKQHRDPNEVVNSGDFPERLEKINAQCMFANEMAKVAQSHQQAHAAIPNATRDKVRDLQALLAEMTDWAEHASAERVGLYPAKIKESAQKLTQILNALVPAFGMDPDEFLHELTK
jgi:hypothetical protein